MTTIERSASIALALAMCVWTSAPARAQPASAQPIDALCASINRTLSDTPTAAGPAPALNVAADALSMKLSLGRLEADRTAAQNALSKATADGDKTAAANERQIIAQLQKTVSETRRDLDAANASAVERAKQKQTLREKAAAAGCPPPVAALDLAGNWVIHTVITRPGVPVTEYTYDALLSGPAGGPWKATETLRATTSQSYAGRVGSTDSACSVVLVGGGVGLSCPVMNPDGSVGPNVTCPGGRAGAGYAGACPANGVRWELRPGAYKG